MTIAVCCKPVPDVRDAEFRGNGSIYYRDRQMIIGKNDLKALAVAANFKEVSSESLVAVCVARGEELSAQLKKDILARGADSLVIVDASNAKDNNYTTATILAEVVKTIGDVDLVVCGSGSDDHHSQQVGILLGVILGAAVLNSISSLSRNDDCFIVERQTENAIERFEVPGSMVVSMCEDLPEPSAPSLISLAKAGSKPISSISADDFTSVSVCEGYATVATKKASDQSGDDLDMFPVLKMLKLLRAGGQIKRRKTMLPSDPKEAAFALVENLNRDMVL